MLISLLNLYTRMSEVRIVYKFVGEICGEKEK